jgi:hypothetical protein
LGSIIIQSKEDRKNEKTFSVRIDFGQLGLCTAYTHAHAYANANTKHSTANTYTNTYTYTSASAKPSTDAAHDNASRTSPVYASTVSCAFTIGFRKPKPKPNASH